MNARDELKAIARLEDLKATIRRLQQKLVRAKDHKEDLILAVYRAVKDSLGDYEPPILPPLPPLKKGTETPETAIVVFSDWQLAKKTPTYNSKVCAERVARYCEKAVMLINRHRLTCPVRDVRVYLLGDLIEGEMIFPGQSYLIDASLYMQVVSTGPSILSKAILRLAQADLNVHVEGVIGNHGAIGGRARKDYHPETNADAMMYEVARQMLGPQERITWGPNVIPGERRWFAVDQVGKHRSFLFHGDQIKGGFAGFPWYGFSKKLLGWHAAPPGGETFDYAFSAHFHTPVRMYVNGITLWGNGSTESSNTYAAEQLAAAGEPCQWLFFMHPTIGITAEYLVHLEK